MCVEYDGSQVKDVPSFNWTFLIKPGYLYYYIYVVATLVALT
jgi:hypothetical protein